MKTARFYLVAALLLWRIVDAEATAIECQFLFPHENWHNHSSTIAELPNGDLLVAWYHGSGEGEADDVEIRGMRKVHGQEEWTAPFLMADTPELPDLNPVLFLDSRNVLWLFWPTFLDNTSESILIKYRTASDLSGNGAPHWEWQDVLHVRPPNFKARWLSNLDAIDAKRAERKEGDLEVSSAERTADLRAALDDKLTTRVGWMVRTPPVMVSDTRMMLGLYHDYFACSLAAYTDDWGKTWSFSEPILDVYLALVQPSFAMKTDGSLVAYMRDNGYPKHIRVANSYDKGATWESAPFMAIPNPGSSIQVLVLKNGHWLLVCNDLGLGTDRLSKGRHRLTVYLSEDEGQTWEWRRVLEDAGEGKARLDYPTVIQARDGSIHGTYSHRMSTASGERSECIKYVHFDEAWVKEASQTDASPTPVADPAKSQADSR